MLESIGRLYQTFDRVFPKPDSFFNKGCCVSADNVKMLLKTPRGQLDEQTLAMPIDHYGSCFGRFEEVSYFIPRLMEILAESDGGFEYGLLCYSFYRILRNHQPDYESLALWNSIWDAMQDIFRTHTEQFKVRHCDREACAGNGWAIQHSDYVVGSDLLDQMLEGYFGPVLSRSSASATPKDWDTFIDSWAHDDNPSRVAHLLDVVGRYLLGRYVCGVRDDYQLPEGFLRLLKDKSYVENLLSRAKPAIEAADSPTWFDDLCDSLELAAGGEQQ
jgi:hypothetical protein